MDIVMTGVLICGINEAYTEWYKEYGRVFGTYHGAHPILHVGDVDMLREITVKEFNNFSNRSTYGVNDVTGPPTTDFLFHLNDDKWRHNRNTLTPTFSSGKLKKMTEMMLEASRQMVDALKANADSGEPIEMKDHTGAYIMDVIASTAFGIKTDTQKKQDDPFIIYSNKFFFSSAGIFSLGGAILFFAPFLKPLIRWLKIPVSPKESLDFFADIVKKALVERRKNPGKYADFLQLMINAEKEAQDATDKKTEEIANGDVTELANGETGHWKDKRKGKGLTDAEILAAAITMFVAGYDTTASALAYLFYHLARNPSCMDRLLSEIDKHFPNGKEPDYESAHSLPYLEMVVSESLRISPPVARVNRVCEKHTTVNGVTIPAGMIVGIPFYMIHHDPGYWHDPETFDPERFTPENRATHHPLQWIPFGKGPRNCIGMRLALFELKIAIIKLLQKYRFVPNSKTVSAESIQCTGISSYNGTTSEYCFPVK